MRIESSVTAISWIPSEAVEGLPKIPFTMGMAHYDDPPPDEIEDLDAMREADLFREANELKAFVEFGDDGSVQHEEIHAREASVEAALGRLEELELEWPGHLELIEQLRARYTHAEEHLEHDHEAEGLREPDQEQIDHEAIRRSVIDSQRVAIIDLRDRGIIGDAALRRVERDLDLEELRAEG